VLTDIRALADHFLIALPNINKYSILNAIDLGALRGSRRILEILKRKINTGFKRAPRAMDLFNIVSLYLGTLPSVVYRFKGRGMTSSSNLAARVFPTSSTSSSMSSSSSSGMSM
jgi:hypothetical protein